MSALVVVLGYSDGRSEELHPICAARLARAGELAAGARAVLLSGWARRGGGVAEAELMRRAWPGPELELRCDAAARHTWGNALAAARHARAVGARELLVVTSGWHRPRAELLFRGILAGSGVRVRAVPAGGRATPRLVLRELASLALVPAQVLAGRRALRR